MDQSTESTRFAGWLKDMTGEIELEKGARDSSETLIASAEYELKQLKQRFADARLAAADGDREPPRPVPLRAAFTAKLRKPDNCNDPEWWAAPGHEPVTRDS